MKKILKNTVGIERLLFLLNLKNLLINFVGDFFLFFTHSTVFRVNNISKIEAQLILDYHSLEKGMLFKEMKPRFARMRVERMHKHLNNQLVINNISNSQIQVAYQIICKYYELHKDGNYDISAYFTIDQYEKYKFVLNSRYSTDFEGVVRNDRDSFYQMNESSFNVFAHSRKSIRDFTGEAVDNFKIRDAISLAITAPSVCNRQASKVYLLTDKSKIDAVLKIQSGFTGYSENVNQLLIVTNDRNYYYTVGERNQFYIDGGLFVMNLLYSLHYYKIANCPANWGKTIHDEKRLDKIINIPKSEKIICLIPIGVAKESFNVTLSKRREINEILKEI